MYVQLLLILAIAQSPLHFSTPSNTHVYSIQATHTHPYHYPVRIHNGIESVCYCQNSTLCKFLSDSLLYNIISSRREQSSNELGTDLGIMIVLFTLDPH